ncbi:MAG: SH3 domain-containing protein, partial [Chloroflexota bacterium]
GGGALVRTEPGGGTVITTLINGTLVEVLPEIQSVGNIQWVRIRTLEGLEGWVLQNVLAAATPAPTPTRTRTFTPTP